MKKLAVVGVRVRVADDDHEVLVILREANGPRALPIVIGPHEGIAIATAQAGVRLPRPGPHDLLLTALAAADTQVQRVWITAVRHGTFFAELGLSNEARVDSRASDAISIALRADVEIWCADEILDELGLELELDADQSDSLTIEVDDGDQGPDEAEIAEFRRFLDAVLPTDFDGPGNS
ncbi:MAG: bifunctional nuclease family protein [Beutenbergiaceae bacterium]